SNVAAAVRELDAPLDTRAHAEHLRAKVAAATGDDALSAGVGGPKRGATGAHLALLQAEQAAVVGRTFNGGGHVTLFEDLGPLCFVLGRPESDIRESSERVLGPLADGEHDHLVRTLEAFLRLHGSLNAGAAALLVSIYVFVSEAEVVPSVFGLACYVVGWYLAKRFGRPAAASGATPWLDTMLPFGIALFAIVPALVGPFVGGINVAVGI